MLHRTALLLASSLVLLLLAGCGASTQAFLKAMPAHSTVRGEILRVEGLAAERFEKLSDGVAVHVAAPGCKVTMQLGKKKEHAYEVGPGSIIVFGDDADLLMRDETGSRQ